MDTQDRLNSNKKVIKQMIFIYQALLDGWTVKMINKTQFKLQK
jgi:hypothetical protein